MNLKDAIRSLEQYPKTPLLPVLFVGHGSPMNGVEDNRYARAWSDLAKKIPTPKAIVVISAHWLSDDTEVDVSKSPETIYDFYGFPEQLYNVKYPAPGEPVLAGRLAEGLAPEYDVKRIARGLDHGAWIVLLRMFPKADIPVFQLAIDFTKDGRYHYELGRALAPLRERGVLILASGNIVHNLRVMDWTPGAKAFDWAEEFDEKVKSFLLKRDNETLIDHSRIGRSAGLAVPTADHYFPLLYALGAAGERQTVTFPVEGIDMGSISMRSVLWSALEGQ